MIYLFPRPLTCRLLRSFRAGFPLESKAWATSEHPIFRAGEAIFRAHVGQNQTAPTSKTRTQRRLQRPVHCWPFIAAFRSFGGEQDLQSNIGDPRRLTVIDRHGLEAHRLAVQNLLFGSTNLSRCDRFSRRNREMKEGTRTNCAFQRKLRSMFLHDPLCQSQPKSRSFRAATAHSIRGKIFQTPALDAPGRCRFTCRQR